MGACDLGAIMHVHCCGDYIDYQSIDCLKVVHCALLCSQASLMFMTCMLCAPVSCKGILILYTLASGASSPALMPGVSPGSCGRRCTARTSRARRAARATTRPSSSARWPCGASRPRCWATPTTLSCPWPARRAPCAGACIYGSACCVNLIFYQGNFSSSLPGSTAHTLQLWKRIGRFGRLPCQALCPPSPFFNRPNTSKHNCIPVPVTAASLKFLALTQPCFPPARWRRWTRRRRC